MQKRGESVKLQEINQQLSLKVQAAADKLGREVTGGYASDLLSCVMAKAESGNVWVTIQGHPNIVAVASLLDLAGIIVAEGMNVDAATVEKAEHEGVPILSTSLTTYTIVSELFKLGVLGIDA
jgi:predicted transcriptional regulator